MTAKDNLFCFASAKSNGFKTARLGWLILKFFERFWGCQLLGLERDGSIAELSFS